MGNETTVWVIGGDERYRWAVDHLREYGVMVKTRGVPGMPDDAETLSSALMGAGAVLLPMKPLEDGVLRIKEESLEAVQLPMLLHRGCLLVLGSMPDNLESWFREQGINCGCYLENENYLLKNADVTAEGALCLAMEHMKITVKDAEILVVGWGRIGKYLSKKLRSLGAKVTVGSRRREQLCYLQTMGYSVWDTMKEIENAEAYVTVFNTVPESVFTLEQLGRFSDDCIMIELASEPGGYPEEYRSRVVMGRGLPGKTAPKTAGKILAESVMDYMKGEERDME